MTGPMSPLAVHLRRQGCMHEGMVTDPFAELFRALRVKGAVYFAQDFSPPWGMRLPPRPHAQFHVALSGTCQVEAGGHVFTLAAQDVVLFPNGAPHVISDGSGTEPRDGREVVQAIRRGGFPFHGEQATVRLLSGHFEFDRGARHPLVVGLPEVVRGSGRGDTDAALFSTLYPLLSAEAASLRPGAEAIVERLAEIFLVQLVRAHFSDSPPQTGILAAMFDRRLAAAISVIHSRWAEPLTLHDLAHAAGMSRSTFAERFRSTAEIPPMIYLARWRLLKARDMLQDRTLSVAQVAAACGHRSTEGFSRAFRRAYDESPTALIPNLSD